MSESHWEVKGKFHITTIFGVNSTAITTGSFDISPDGFPEGSPYDPAARDVLGFALHYYDAIAGTDTWQDYKPIGGGAYFARPGTGSNFVSLYNGNIGAISLQNAGLEKGNPTTNSLPLFYNYRYDALNRLVSMKAYKGLNTATNLWTPIALDDYGEQVSYDPNGNITAYNRKGAPETGQETEMDALAYHYTATTNRLDHIYDTIPSGKYATDIDAQSTGNYTYDAIGNLKTDVTAGITDIDWSVYGKITRIEKGSADIIYTYDAAGNRISKTADGKLTVYVRDASGNVMSIYEKPSGSSLTQAEQYIYGSSRLGVQTLHAIAPESVPLASGFDPATVNILTRGEKLFELSNHLGNVLATVTDRKVQYSSGGTNLDYYKADVKTVQDYAPFGALMPGRAYNTSETRYGFNGKENDNEVKGEGNQQDYGMRIYDPRVGRFLSTDPLTMDYSHLTPYQFASNTPIAAIDWDGAEARISIGGTGNGANYNQSQKYAFEKWTIDQRKNGFYYAGIVSSGNQLLDKFKESTRKEGSILNVITFTHSGPEGIFLNTDEGFYRGNALRKTSAGRNVSDLVSALKSGEIKFESGATWILASCFTASNFVGPGLAESITKETGISTVEQQGMLFQK